MTPATWHPGRVAFDAYRERRGGLNHDGTPTPEWDDLGSEIRAGWEAGAAAVLAEAERLRAFAMNTCTDVLMLRDTRGAKLADAGAFMCRLPHGHDGRHEHYGMSWERENAPDDRHTTLRIDDSVSPGPIRIGPVGEGEEYPDTHPHRGADRFIGG